MRPPDFWRRSPASPLARFLSLLGKAYGAAAAARMARAGARAGLPTIVVGGFTTGGDGKTPTALALASLLEDMGERPVFLSRGYGRSRPARSEPFLVDLAQHSARDAGDEPMLLARVAPTIIGNDRSAAAPLARDIGASVLVLDDGLQSRRLEPDFVIAVVDSTYGAGNGLCLPAGPLRAPLGRQIELVDAIVAIGSCPCGDGVLRLARAAEKKLFGARTAPDERIAASLLGRRVLAFAGVARPEKFLSSLVEAGATVEAVRWFSDHHRFTRKEIASLARYAAHLNATLVTTEKDAVRLPEQAEGPPVLALPVHLVFDETEAVRSALGEALKRARINRDG